MTQPTSRSTTKSHCRNRNCQI